MHAYTEDQLVEQPAIGLLATLGWHTVSAMEETFGMGGTLGRETKGEVLLVDRLRAALTKLNPGQPLKQCEQECEQGQALSRMLAMMGWHELDLCLVGIAGGRGPVERSCPRW
jgi:hypothetical protein